MLLANITYDLEARFFYRALDLDVRHDSLSMLVGAASLCTFSTRLDSLGCLSGKILPRQQFLYY
jgi:hypothetical protein